MSNQLQLFNPDLEPIRYIAEHGTFEFTLDGKFNTFWLTQKQIAELFNLTVQAVNLHIQNFKKTRSEDIDSAIKQSLITAADGKTYRVEQYNHQVVIYIGYRAQATQETIRFQRFHEEVFRQRLESEHERAQTKARFKYQQKVTGYILDGFTPSHAELRVDVGDKFKELTAAIQRACGDPRAFGAAIRSEYLSLFGLVTSRLKEVLQTKNIRDALPELQLGYLRLAEMTMTAVLDNQDHMTVAQIEKVVTLTVKPLGQHLQDVCKALGVDVVTGRAILAAGEETKRLIR